MSLLTQGDRVRLTFEGVVAHQYESGAAGFMLDGGMVERAFSSEELHAAKVEVLKPLFKRDDVVLARIGENRRRGVVVAVDEDLGRAWVRLLCSGGQFIVNFELLELAE